MFKRNYKFEKQRKDEANKKKREEKRQKKLERSERTDPNAIPEAGTPPAEKPPEMD